MHQAATVLRENAEKYADLMAMEMGKPIRDGVAEVQKCAAACDYCADNAEHFLATEPIKTDARKSHVIFQPLGVVLAVMPWSTPRMCRAVRLPSKECFRMQVFQTICSAP
jgi:succinate-semialdehyde dehydrogenase/glutarate-semialdehyde dehydrogenase